MRRGPVQSTTEPRALNCVVPRGFAALQLSFIMIMIMMIMMMIMMMMMMMMIMINSHIITASLSSFFG